MSNTPQLIGVHLDLKYMMPDKRYLHCWLREISAMGINALLLEYEDKFPFEKYSFLRAPDAFTPEELQSFLSEARQCGIRVIPLVQTLSHLEFALAHEELAHLREAPDILTQINPAHPEALAFVHELIEEVLAYHRADEYFHLGADEAWFLGTHPDYAEEVERIGAPVYWAKHLRPFMQQIIEAGKRPIVWDDMFWNNPKVISELELPRELILMAWNYDIRDVDTCLDVLSLVDVYQLAGFDVIGAPCLNQGVLTPLHDHVWENAASWAKKIKQSNLLGLFNTSWAVFHTPLPTQMLYIAETAALLNCDVPVDDRWLVAWAKDYFGIEEVLLPDALRDLSLNWEQKIEGLGRPITPVVYGYMDLVLHFGKQKNRMKQGCYPLDWNEVDFCNLYKQKIALLRDVEDQHSIAGKLDELQVAYNRAAPILKLFAERATRHREEAQLLSCFAALKYSHVCALKFLLGLEENSERLHDELTDMEEILRESLRPFFQPRGVEWLVRLWWEPVATALSRGDESPLR